VNLERKLNVHLERRSNKVLTIIFVLCNMEECPVCLEQLSGTVVNLGCCKKQVHIQCYISKCPFCRSELPVPIHAAPPQHIIIPIPVDHPQHRSNLKGILATLICMGVITAPLFVFTIPHPS
jgi:hypothetical protein